MIRALKIITLLSLFLVASASAQTDDKAKIENEESVATPKETSEASPIKNQKRIPKNTPKNTKDSKNKSVPSAQITSGNIKLEFYQPFLGLGTNKKFVDVVITGKTLPYSTVEYSPDIIRILDASVKEVKVKKSFMPIQQTQANSKGEFQLQVILPKGAYQIPIKVRKGSQNASYQLILEISPEKIIANTPTLAGKSPFLKTNQLSVGLGVNFVLFKQDSNYPSSTTFQSINLGAFYIDYWKQLSNEYQVLLTAKLTPGETASSEQAQVRDKTFNWIMASATGVYFPQKFRYKRPNDTLRMGFQAGLQYHSVPFINILSETPSVVEVNNNQILFGALGMHFELEQARTFLYEIFFRLQFPLYSENVFNLDSAYGIEGSIGLEKYLGKRWSIGAFWYGVFHWYTFSQNNTSLSQNLKGDIYLFYSNAEFRVGYRF